MENNQTLFFRLKGNVQGVGMRYFIYHTAKNYGVTGYVKNLRDGSVECVAQGKNDDIDMFVKHIKNNSPGHISNIEKEDIEDSERYASFEITF